MTERKNIRNFGLALGIALALFGTRLFFKFHNPNFLYLVAAGSAFVILGFAFPPALKPAHYVFGRIASFVIGWLITRVVLMIGFYFVIAPIGLFLRFIRKDLLALKVDKKIGSYWAPRERRVIEPGQYEKQF